MVFCYISNNFFVSYWVWLAFIYLRARWFSACRFYVSAEIFSATWGVLTILSSGWTAVRLKFTHHFIKNCALENAKLLHSRWWIVGAVHWGELKSLPSSWLLVEIFSVSQGEKIKQKKKKIEKFKKKKVLKIYRLSSIFWLTTCMFY